MSEDEIISEALRHLRSLIEKHWLENRIPVEELRTIPREYFQLFIKAILTIEGFVGVVDLEEFLKGYDVPPSRRKFMIDFLRRGGETRARDIIWKMERIIKEPNILERLEVKVDCYDLETVSRTLEIYGEIRKYKAYF